jgi:hypothetical protein
LVKKRDKVILGQDGDLDINGKESHEFLSWF